MDLSKINNPTDIANLTYKECKQLAGDIRETIIQTVSKNGGHLSSNLGAVEMTIALHRAFHTPLDQIVFDVGHQSYTHKLLTGRYQDFHTLRQYGGLSGFPKCSESEHDCFETGHASTGISAALGLARARDLQGKDYHVVAVVGDGALTGGMCYEALNDCGNTKTKLIVVINDNEMSITRNVGALSKHMAKLRSSWGWYSAKRKVQRGILRIPWIGKTVEQVLYTIKRAVRALFVDETFFSALGFTYLGPIDGHDIKAMETVFRRAQKMDVPVAIHLSTVKGYGYQNAEEKPDVFHGTPPFFIDNGLAQSDAKTTYGSVAAKTLTEMADTDERIAVITAAMTLGTATDIFQKRYPKRFFDVGIAEEHAVTMAAGLAKGGMRPYFFVYSTFLQRGYDQVIHDVCMQNLPVVLMLDRSGLANGDGQSHQGLFDIAYLRHIPNMHILAPADSGELQEMVRQSLSWNGPCAIRYPKKAAMPNPAYPTTPFTLGKWKPLIKGNDAVILAVGSMVGTAIAAANRLQKNGISMEAVNASTVKPLDESYLKQLEKRNIPVFTLEEHVLDGGFGSSLLEYNAMHGDRMTVHPIAVPDQFIPHGDHAILIKEIGLDAETVTQRIMHTIANGNYADE
ncbi:MAG TPA: 1-deoxy-D-xylulose-5-phosphate synthase [Candidatus Limiplasma sp.]|nr:1-deoxy-D-xylulose-5-phosphate synthase [Candidatus Limiplasma sp.]